MGTDQRWGSVAVLLAGLGLSGCLSTGQLADLIQEPPATAIAFESIEGPPPAVFRRFANSLKTQAGAQQVLVVVPSQANYRLRGYLAAHAEDGITSIAWAWDVYNADQRRAFRLVGEEKAGDARQLWEAADDQVLNRIARSAMQQLAVMAAARTTLDASSPPPPT
jgi:hypothetical protein